MIASLSVQKHTRCVLHNMAACFTCCFGLAGSVPPTWGQPGAFPALQFLDIKSCILTGTLPSSWPPALQYLNVADNSFHGPLPTALSRLTQLQQLTLNDNPFTGPLPAHWGFLGAFPELYSLQIVNAHLNGSLPDAWGSPTALSSLQTLVLRGIKNLTGTLPDSWAVDGAFPQLLSLGLEGTSVTGPGHHKTPFRSYKFLT